MWNEGLSLANSGLVFQETTLVLFRWGDRRLCVRVTTVSRNSRSVDGAGDGDD